MALKARNKASVAFSMSSMTDIVFLLLIFFMITSTLVMPNALNILYPQSNGQTSQDPVVKLEISENLEYYLNDEKISFGQLERKLNERLRGVDNPVIALHADQRIQLNEAVKVMEIARENKYKMILATRPKEK